MTTRIRVTRCSSRPSFRRLVPRRTARSAVRRRRDTSPDYLNIICCAFQELIRLDKRLMPFMQQQRELLEQELREAQWEPAFERVYGPYGPDNPRVVRYRFSNQPVDIPQLLKDQKALLKSKLVLAKLKSKLHRTR